MKSEKKTDRYLPSDHYDPFDAFEQEDAEYPEISSVASACECTGMMPRPPVNSAEEESYRELFSGEIPKKK